MLQRSSRSALLLMGLAVVLSACADAPAPTAVDDALLPTAEAKKNKNSGGDNVLDQANATLALQGSDHRIAYAEYYTLGESGEVGTVIFANDRGNKRLAVDFIPDDPRRGGADGDPNTIDFWVDVTQGATASGLSATETTDAIARAMGTWDDANCSALGASVNPVAVDIGLVQASLGFGGTGIAVSDVAHAGWLPPAFFDAIAPNGSSFILGVTFTLTFATGDLDGDGAADLGAREIYYNDAFIWADDGTSDVDVETVALHEAGHGLSQAHFGKIFGTPSNGKLHFAPRAVMNASYSGVQRELAGTDNGGHCGLWGSWPSN